MKNLKNAEKPPRQRSVAMGGGWQSSHHLIPQSCRAWLCWQGSFMRRLREKQVRDIRITVLRETHRGATLQEALLLGTQPRARLRTRDVFIHSPGNEWMFARTLLPQQLFTGTLRQLACLKQRALGSILFGKQGMQRNRIAYKNLTLHDPLYAATVKIARALPEILHARRSLFSRVPRSKHRISLLLTEVFLPDIFNV